MLDWLRGLHTPPIVVGTIRGIVEAGVLAAILEASILIRDLVPPESLWVALIPAAFGIIAGYADQIDPEKKRAP